MNLTDMEKTVLLATRSFWNYGNRMEKGDNAVVFDVRDLKESTNFTIPQIKGVVGSLFKKGLLCEMECGDLGQNTEIGITNEGIDMVCDLEGIE